MKLSPSTATVAMFFACTLSSCEGGMMEQKMRRDLQEQVLPQQLEKSCGEFTYELFIAAETQHLGMFALPTNNEDDNAVPDECGPVFFHQPDPATKALESSSFENFFSGALYPMGDHKMKDILKAFDSVPVADAEYDIIQHHCGLLVLQMMCSLEIPLVQGMKDWVVDELMRTNESRDHIVSLTHNSANFELLGIARNESAAASIRTLVAYDADMFVCPATAAEDKEAGEHVECSGSNNMFGSTSAAYSLLSTAVIALMALK